MEVAHPVRNEPLPWLASLLLIGALAVIAVWTVQRTSWYLAIDQFGYLTFAKDLSQGHALHQWNLLPALRSLLPANADIDVYAQTYVRRGNDLFCRYAPGFPLMLALARVLFGATGEHFVNPAALVLLLGCVFAIGRRVSCSEWVGLAAALLVALLPNYVLLWSTSPLRDVPAHLLAFAGLFLLLPGGRWLRPGWREAAAGLFLGCAVSTRIDALLYLLPAGAIALLSRAWFARRLALGAVAFAIGLGPLLAYNYTATGNPFRPTQLMELNAVLSSAESPARDGWWQHLSLTTAALADEEPDDPALDPQSAAGVVPDPQPTPVLVQGGGLRLRNLGRSLPANVELIREAFGDLGIVLALVGALAALRRPALFLLVVPYTVVALLFFSLWTVPGTRYITGILLLLPLLVVQGAGVVASLPAMLAGRGKRVPAVAVGVLLVAVLAWFVARAPSGDPSALPQCTAVLAAGIVIGMVGESSGRVRVAHLTTFAIGLGLAATLFWRSTSTLGVHATFQRPQMERARAQIDEAVDMPAVVLTSTRIGRAAENINYYTPADAIYLEEMTRWQAQPRYAIGRLLQNGFAVYLLLPPDYARRWLANTNISSWYKGEVVRRIPAAQAADYFVASPYHHGIPLWLVRLDYKAQPG